MTAARTLLLACCALVAFAAWGQGSDQELLPEDQAFRVEARAAGADRVDLVWTIARDYYMYKDKFGARVLKGDATLGDLEMPKGKIKSDPLFGKIETFVGSVTVGVPVKRPASSGPLELVIEAAGQGCNEPVGVCYPPQKREMRITLAAATASTTPASPAAQSPAAEAPAAPAKSATSLKSLSELLRGSSGGQQDEFLPPDEAFKMHLEPRDAGSLTARFEIAKGYYLYQDKFKFKSLTEGVSTGTVTMPPGKEKHDEYFGKIVAYYNNVDLIVPLTRNASTVTPARFEVGYQGCAEKGICYPPQTKTIDLTLPPAAAASAPRPAARSATAAPVKTDSAAGGFWGPVLLAFVAGIFLTFTPCVLPMIPILASIIVGQGDQVTKARGGALSVAYVLGTAVTYTGVGILAGLTGDQLQAYFQNAWFIGTVATILVLLALSMFGLYEIQMPSAIQSRLQMQAQGLRGGTYGAVFVMGVISAAIVGACVSPVLMAVLGLAIQRGDPVLGGAIMFSMAWGMGVFLVAIGLGAGFILPRAGAWMDRVKQAFGVLLLAVAIYLLGVIPEVPVLYLWSALFIVCAVFLGALQSLPEQANGWRYLWKGAGVFMLIWGVLALLGGMSGNRDILKPVDIAGGVFAPRGAAAVATEKAVHFTRVSNIEALDRELERARSAGKPVLLDYFADWCVDCVRMEKKTFMDDKVQAALKDFHLVQVDVTDPRDEATKAIKKRYGVFGPPAMLFFGADGNERPALRRYGFMEPQPFLEHIAQIGRSAETRVLSQQTR